MLSGPLQLGAQEQTRPEPPGGDRGGGGSRIAPGAVPAQEVVSSYDRNGDGWLNRDERAKARAALKKMASTQKSQGRRGPPGMSGSDGEQTTNEAGIALTPADVEIYPDAPFYDTEVLRTLFLTFENDDWEEELEVFRNTDVKVPATLVVDGRTYPNVGVKFRGNSSYAMVPRGSKRSFALTMDLADSKQKLGGYRNLNLLNANGDASFMRTILTREIGKNYLPMPQSNWVRVVVNGESWGIYVNQQQQDKIFLKEQFGTKKGYRWKVPGSPDARGSLNDIGENLDDYREIYELKSKEDLRAWVSLILLCKNLDAAEPENLEAELGTMLDLDGVLRFLALENALVNSDGYWTRASDYLIYLHPDGIFHILPYDYNETLMDESGGPGGGGGSGGGRRGPPPIANMQSSGNGEGKTNQAQRPGPPPGGGGGHDEGGTTLEPLVSAERNDRPLASRLLAVPELRARYLEYVQEIAEQWLDPEVLGPMISKYDKLLDADVWDDTRKLESYEAYCTQVDLDPAGDGLLGFAAQRRAFLLEHAEIKATQPENKPAVQHAKTTSFQLSSPAVADGGMLPVDFTGDGAAATLPLDWSGAPEGTKRFAVIMHHIAPDQTKWYWILYNLSATTTALPRNVSSEVGVLGNNSVNGRTEYAPPHSKGPGEKTYIYTVYALSEPVSIAAAPEDVNRDVLLTAMKGKILATAELTTVYERSGNEDENPPPVQP
jgi:Raf kinase inhibitor-like YbhB/YbcL family protein